MDTLGIQMIARERAEQIEKHGWTADFDAALSALELPRAAIYSITLDKFNPLPESWDTFSEKIEKKSYLERLIIAGALIAAEIDREINSKPKIDELIKNYEHELPKLLKKIKEDEKSI